MYKMIGKKQIIHEKMFSFSRILNVYKCGRLRSHMTRMSYKNNEKLRAYELFFKALSNDTRITIIDLLRSEDKTVSEIVDTLGFEQSRVSHNLKCLTFCGFVTNRKEGKKRIYSLNMETIEPLLNIADRHIEIYADHLHKCEVLRR